MIRRLSREEEQVFIKSLMKWCREDELTVSRFPRDFYSPDLKRREVVEDYEDVLIRVDKCYCIDCYLSIFSKAQIKRKIFDVIFLDVDEAKNYPLVLEKIDKFPHVCYFSGRGYHIYLKFGEMKFNNYRATVREFVEIYGLKSLIDTNTLGDVNRVARLPMTWNSKTNKQAKLIEEKDGDVDLLRDILSLLDEKSRHKRLQSFEGDRKKIREADFSILPPCIQECIKEIIETGELAHEKRLHLASFLVWVWDYEDVKALFSLCNDYKEHYTEQQLKWIIERKYCPYSCKHAKQLGICPLTGSCAFAPSLHLYLDRRKKK